MTNLELSQKCGAIVFDELIPSETQIMFTPSQLDTYSRELLEQASSEPVGYMSQEGIKKSKLSSLYTWVALITTKDHEYNTEVYLANPLNTEMVETIKRLEEALREAMYSNSTAIAKDKADKALASISPAIKQQYLDN
jgi:hypothetical protein